MQKQNYEQEQRRLEERKQFCSECYNKLIDGQCQRCIAARERPQICDRCCVKLVNGKCMGCTIKCRTCDRYLAIGEVENCAICVAKQKELNRVNQIPSFSITRCNQCNRQIYSRECPFCKPILPRCQACSMPVASQFEQFCVLCIRKRIRNECKICEFRLTNVNDEICSNCMIGYNPNRKQQSVNYTASKQAPTLSNSLAISP